MMTNKPTLLIAALAMTASLAAPGPALAKASRNAILISSACAWIKTNDVITDDMLRDCLIHVILMTQQGRTVVYNTTGGGSRGQKGADGVDGAVGPRGADGAPGPVGPQGQDGKDGTDGTDGAPGPQGPAGPQGEPGESGCPGNSCGQGPDNDRD
tara:strand:+ start:7975 stop:8439 length:465 start_codon:yes stop_codon:yes gene_type:complete